MANATHIVGGGEAVGLDFLPDEDPHGLLADLLRDAASGEMVCISEHCGAGLERLGERHSHPLNPADGALSVLIERTRWLALAPAFWEDANRRLRANGLPVARFVKNPAKPAHVQASLGKDLCVLCWAVEEAPPTDIPNALRNWEALAPEVRWWPYTMTVATTGQAMQKGIGWRKALRAALADNPFIKGEGVSPRARRE